LQENGFPALVLLIDNEYDLGAEFYRWEVATAVASAMIGVNSFDQPDVQDSKERTKAKIQAFQEQGRLDEGQPAWQGPDAVVYGELALGMRQAGSLTDLIESFLALGQPGDYVALNAYLPRRHRFEVALQRLRVAIRQRTRLATTVGFGPRFLHSTGQLHKGGPDTGLFLQITSDPERDVEIPGQSLTFATLLKAQALGDLEALLARGRHAIRIHLNQFGALEELVNRLES
jgi:transaldolase/glucose-6-phosphate isomerase